jgi:hypothetical protein
MWNREQVYGTYHKTVIDNTEVVICQERDGSAVVRHKK